MYPSGQWEGFWVQNIWGRQAMTPFFLVFRRSGERSREGYHRSVFVCWGVR